jgi:hypothetical protein
MTRFAITGNATCTGSTTRLSLTSTAAIQPALYDILLSSSATPASHVAQWQIKRFTAAGTSTNQIPVDLGSQDLTATGIGGSTHTVEPTYTANKILLQLSVNQQATFRWVAAPDGEIIIPSATAKGVGLFVNSTDSAFAADMTFHYKE